MNNIGRQINQTQNAKYDTENTNFEISLVTKWKHTYINIQVYA